ncbi:nitrate- and nitrite sensing domain-containing protein [Kitasatospora sp. NPDC058965]|uniref:sensor histidine kinase n=1 Tax=Kitasatospora sp. NPDC058965 TaxID=3346682 RepID=UPI0036A83414
MSAPAVVPHEENALRTRRASRLSTTKARRPRLTLRTALLVLAIVPSVALAALWGITTTQTLTDYQRQAAQGLLFEKAGQPSNTVYYNLQEERRLTAEQLARPGTVTEALAHQRKLTDDAVHNFLQASAISVGEAPTDVMSALGKARQALTELSQRRAAVDQNQVDQETAFTYYSGLIEVDLNLFAALSHVDNGEVGYLSRTLVAEFWATEMVSREDALLTRGWPTGKLPAAELPRLQGEISVQGYLYVEQMQPYLPADEGSAAQRLTSSQAWQTKSQVEGALLRPSAPDASGQIPLPAVQEKWRPAIDSVLQQLNSLVQTRTERVLSTQRAATQSLLVKLLVTSAVGLLAVVVVVLTSWRLTRSLRRRIMELHHRAGELERTLPEVVDRLAGGEQVAVEADEISSDSARPDGDELTRLAQALTLARSSAIGAAVRQAEQHRGFEKLLQRIARRTQLLIGLQLKTLDEMERKHEDPEVLEGLFDLDHLTARLRRYEENLVILAGGQPQRRWRRPVPLLDVLRAAQGEVQDYRRILLDVEGTPWLNERAVGPVVHVLAELMENAAAFSKPPTPVEVRAAMVGRGLAVEIEDRGLGMESGQYDAANDLMRRPPRLDVLAQADDIRLGLYVVARLATALDLKVEFRPSSFGGTRAVVLIPGELVTNAPLPAEPVAAVLTGDGDPLPARTRGRALADLPAPLMEVPVPQQQPPVIPAQPGAVPVQPGAARPSWARYGEPLEHGTADLEPPLPQRVRQASLAAELRTPEPEAAPAPSGDAPARYRSGATIGAFQRRSRAARFGDFGDETAELHPPIPTTEDQS